MILRGTGALRRQPLESGDGPRAEPSGGLPPFGKIRDTPTRIGSIMKLKGYFWILAVSGTGAAAALGVLALPEKPLLFWSAEAGALIILLLFIGLYRKLVRPYQLLFSGIDLLRPAGFCEPPAPDPQPRSEPADRSIQPDDHTTQAGAFRSARKEPFSRPVDPSLAARCNHPRFRRTDFRDQSCGIEIIENRGFFTGQRAFAGGSALRIDPRAGRVGTLRRDGDPDSGPPRLPLHQILVYGPRFRAPFPAGRRADPGGNETRERVVRTDHPDDRPRGQQLGRGDRFYALRGIGCTPAGRTP